MTGTLLALGAVATPFAHASEAPLQGRSKNPKHPLFMSAALPLHFLLPMFNRYGGELIIEDTYGNKTVKLPAGHLVLYPSTSLHQVTPVTRGARVSFFFWLHSLIHDDQRRSMLFNMDVAIQSMAADDPEHPSVVSLTGVYHNLLRQWAEM